MPRFPQPYDELWITRNGKAVPVASLTPAEWDACEKKMLENVGRALSAQGNKQTFYSK